MKIKVKYWRSLRDANNPEAPNSLPISQAGFFALTSTRFSSLWQNSAGERTSDPSAPLPLIRTRITTVIRTAVIAHIAIWRGPSGGYCWARLRSRGKAELAMSDLENLSYRVCKQGTGWQWWVLRPDQTVLGQGLADKSFKARAQAMAFALSLLEPERHPEDYLSGIVSD
jgi:hypothetical protein